MDWFSSVLVCADAVLMGKKYCSQQNMQENYFLVYAPSKLPADGYGSCPGPPGLSAADES